MAWVRPNQNSNVVFHSSLHGESWIEIDGQRYDRWQWDQRDGWSFSEPESVAISQPQHHLHRGELITISSQPTPLTTPESLWNAMEEFGESFPEMRPQYDVAAHRHFLDQMNDGGLVLV